MAISSQSEQECSAGSTTRVHGPERTKGLHERAAVRTCTKCEATKCDERFSGRSSWCKDCINAYSKVHYRKNRAKVLTRKVGYRKTHKAEAKAANAKWQRENRAKFLKYLAEYRKANREFLLAQKKLHHVKYYAKNKAKYLAKFVARREAKELACPSWANLKVIQNLYIMAREMTEQTGIAYEVDHIVPLKSNLVCGLHVENNLRIITRDENRRKRNNLSEDIV